MGLLRMCEGGEPSREVYSASIVPPARGRRRQYTVQRNTLVGMSHAIVATVADCTTPAAMQAAHRLLSGEVES